MEKTYSIDACIGRQIRHLRNQKKVTQEKLGEVLGVSFQQVQKYERGVNRISAGNLYSVAQLLDVPVSAFFEELNESGMGEEQHPFMVNPPNESERPPATQAFLSVSHPPSTPTSRKFPPVSPSSSEIPSEEIEELVRAYRSVRDPTVRRQVLGLLNSLSNTLSS